MAAQDRAGDRNEIYIARPNGDVPQTPVYVDDVTAKLYQDVSKGNVQIFMADRRGLIGMGSGFVTDNDGHVATDGHVALAAGQLSVLADGKRYDATIDKVDGLNDLVVLDVPGLKHNPDVSALSLNTKPLKPGQEIYTFGHPLGTDVTVMGPGKFLGHVTEGHYESKEDRNYVVRLDHGSHQYLDRKQIFSDAFVLPGSSGGPVVDKQGKVVGIADQLLQGIQVNTGAPDNHSMSTDAKALQALMAAAPKYQFKYSMVPDGLSGRESSLLSPLERSALSGFTALSAGVANGALMFKPIGGLATFYGGYEAYEDGKHLLRSTNVDEFARFGTALVADAGLTAGGIMSFVPSTKGVARLVFAGATALKLGSDYIPYHPFLTSIETNDKRDKLRACFSGGDLACDGGMKPGTDAPKNSQH